MSKVFVLGGTGFVGSQIVRAFLKAGHEVAVSVREKSPRDLLEGLEVEFVPADLTEPESLVVAFKGRDVVVHSAGKLSLWEKHSGELYRTNVLGTRNVVEACLKAKVGRMLYTGSIGVYAGSKTPELVDERGSATIDRFHSFHVTSMCLAEAEVLKGIAQGLDAVLLHPSLCIGEGDRGFHSSWAVVGLAFSRLPFAPPGGLNVVDVRDVGRAHVLAAEKAPAGRIYLIGGENLTNRAFTDLLKELLGIRTPVVPLNRGTIRALGDMGEWIAKLRGADDGTHITLNHAIGESMSLYWFVDDSRAQKELGHGHSPVRQALVRQIDWLREGGHLPEVGFGFRDFQRRFFPSRRQLR